MATILCIDDEADVLHARRLLLESEGYQVLEAASAAEGLGLLKSSKVDLVVLDYWMPGMNGVAAAREIKKMAPTLPVIMLSGLWELPGESVGIANRWILKGYSTKELLEAIKALI
ncbi:MAG: response regulator [Candidatus Acidiferrales bacterium]|jgi:two-component system nitrogen regulation response regulator NtrX